MIAFCQLNKTSVHMVVWSLEFMKVLLLFYIVHIVYCRLHMIHTNHKMYSYILHPFTYYTHGFTHRLLHIDTSMHTHLYLSYHCAIIFI